MSEINNPHDAFVYAQMSNVRVAQDFFCQHLSPSIKKYIDLSTLEKITEHRVTSSLKHLIGDIVYKANYKNF